MTADDAALAELEADLDAVPPCAAGQYGEDEVRRLLVGALLLGRVDVAVEFIREVVSYTRDSEGDVAGVSAVLAALVDIAAAAAAELPPDRHALAVGALSRPETP
jgi:hypothetical protein